MNKVFPPIKVLVCIHNPQIATPVFQALIRGGAKQVTVATDHGDAFDKLLELDIDTIILHDRFPDLGGEEFIKCLRQMDGKNVKAPIVLLMQDPTKESVLAMKQLGVQEIMIPPYTPVAFEKHVNRISKV